MSVTNCGCASLIVISPICGAIPFMELNQGFLNIAGQGDWFMLFSLDRREREKICFINSDSVIKCNGIPTTWQVNAELWFLI